MSVSVRVAKVCLNAALNELVEKSSQKPVSLSFIAMRTLSKPEPPHICGKASKSRVDRQGVVRDGGVIHRCIGCYGIRGIHGNAKASSDVLSGSVAGLGKVSIRINGGCKKFIATCLQRSIYEPICIVVSGA